MLLDIEWQTISIHLLGTKNNMWHIYPQRLKPWDKEHAEKMMKKRKIKDLAVYVRQLIREDK